MHFLPRMGGEHLEFIVKGRLQEPYDPKQQNTLGDYFEIPIDFPPRTMDIYADWNVNFTSPVKTVEDAKRLLALLVLDIRYLDFLTNMLYGDQRAARKLPQRPLEKRKAADVEGAPSACTRAATAAAAGSGSGTCSAAADVGVGVGTCCGGAARGGGARPRAVVTPRGVGAARATPYVAEAEDDEGDGDNDSTGDDEDNARSRRLPQRPGEKRKTADVEGAAL